MTNGEYNRLWDEIHARLTDEEKAFWEKTSALECEFSRRREDLAHQEAIIWRRVALFFAAVSFICLAWISL